MRAVGGRRCDDIRYGSWYDVSILAINVGVLETVLVLAVAIAPPRQV